MAYDGTLKFDTSLDAAGFQKGTNSMDGIVKGMTAFKLLEAGFKAVMNSIDSAVSRYDTLNRFPKVLENMGYSAEASAAATKKLSDGIQGLPTKLDEIVSTAQRLTVLTGNLEESTDTALALNNAFYASGATAADASRGFVQYTQMLSKGKVDIVSWRTLQETMGYALTKTAEAFGFAGQSAQNDLYAALRDGDITFSDFNAKIIELNGGVGGFAEMAKTSTGGIGTAWTNMQTAIVRGTTGIITAIDNGLSETKFKSIENIISSTGAVVEGVLAGMADGFAFVASNADFLVPAIIAVTTATAAYKVATAAATLAAKAAGVVIDGNITKANLSAIATGLMTKAKTALTVATGNAAIALSWLAAGESAAIVASTGLTVAEAALAAVKGVLTGQIGLATAAQLVLNAAWAANPIGLVIAGVAALVVGLIALVSWVGNSSQAYKEGKQYVEDYGDANKELANSLDESTSNFNKNQTAAEASANTSREMLSGLQALSSKGLDRTAQESYQLQAKLNALNSAQQGLNLTIDETTGELSLTNEEIEAYITATESAARATALVDHMKALSEQMVGVESQFISAERQITLWEQQVESGELSTSKYDKLVADLNAEMVELKETQAGIIQEMAQNEEEYSLLLAQQEQARQAILNSQEDEIRAFAAQHHLSYDEIRADMDENNLSFVGWQEENQKTLDKGQESIAEFAGKWGYSLNDVNAAIAASGLTIEEYVDRQDGALEHAKEVLADYTASTTNGFSVMEQESAISLNKYLKNIQKNEEGTANWSKNINTLMDLGINKGVIEQLSKLGPEGAAQAQKFVDELTEMNGGVDLTLGETNAAVEKKLAEIDKTFDTSLETASAAADAQLRAEAYYEAGYASIDKIAEGIEGNPSAVDAATQAGTDIAQNVTTAVKTIDFSSVGQTIGNSLVTSLTSAVQRGAGKFTSAVTGMSTSVQNVLKVMSAQSQSTVTQMMTQINSVILSRTAMIKTAITNMGNSITTALNTAKTQAVNIVTQMMTDINNTVVSRTGAIKSSSATLSNGVVDSLRVMVTGAISVTNNMMDGIYRAMTNKEESLYGKAREIANKIASTMAAALVVKSPSRVMIKLFEYVMMGIYKGMDGMSGMLYREAESIADGIAERLTISPSVASSLAEQMRAVTDTTLLGGSTLVPLAAGTGAAGSVSYSTNLIQNITTPKPLSASEMTREGQDLLHRSQWQLP